MSDTSAEIKAGMRRLLAEKGHKVQFQERYGPDDVSPYGWSDYDAWEHIINGCSWVVPEGTVVKETTYSMFDGTFTGNKDEVGLNAAGVHCACGKYTDVTIRLTTSLGEAIRTLVGYDPTGEMEL